MILLGALIGALVGAILGSVLALVLVQKQLKQLERAKEVRERMHDALTRDDSVEIRRIASENSDIMGLDITFSALEFANLIDDRKKQMKDFKKLGEELRMGRLALEIVVAFVVGYCVVQAGRALSAGFSAFLANSSSYRRERQRRFEAVQKQAEDAFSSGDARKMRAAAAAGSGTLPKRLVDELLTAAQNAETLEIIRRH